MMQPARERPGTAAQKGIGHRMQTALMGWVHQLGTLEYWEALLAGFEGLGPLVPILLAMGESFFPPLLPLPGVKLGLANIVVMYALFFMGPRQALVLDILKALFVFLVSGFTAGFLSLCGGLLSLAVMWVLYYLLPVRPTWFILSVCGALAHNVGQLLGAGVIISSSLSLYYAPVMLVLGLVMGALTSVTLRALLPALGKMGFNTHENRPE